MRNVPIDHYEISIIIIDELTHSRELKKISSYNLEQESSKLFALHENSDLI